MMCDEPDNKRERTHEKLHQYRLDVHPVMLQDSNAQESGFLKAPQVKSGKG